MAQNKKIQQLHRNQRMLQLMVFALITIMVWIAFSLIRPREKKSIDADLKKLAEPLNPSLNTDVLDRIELKTYFSAGELTNFPIYVIVVSEDEQTEQVVKLGEEVTTTRSITPSPSPSPITVVPVPSQLVETPPLPTPSPIVRN